jgi:G3E family GTPase
LAREGRFDQLLIESTGIAEPLPVAATFAFRDEEGESLGPDDPRALAALLTDEIEFADVIVLNKCSDAGPERVIAARAVLRAPNPDAQVIKADHGVVPTEAVLGTGLFDFERAHEHPLWAKELFGVVLHMPETDAYGITSLFYRARRPFHPAGIHAVRNGDLPGVIHAKGHFWLATQPDWVAECSLAGSAATVVPLGRWWAAVPRSRWSRQQGMQAAIAKQWQDPRGNERQEPVFIGRGMDEAALRAALDSALMPVDAGWPAAPEAMSDPFRQWRAATA